jgi:hypothetical protein
VNYKRLKDEEYKTIERYKALVLNIVPHVIDIYPEAHESEPPLFATLVDGGGDVIKEGVDGFYWNTSLSWEEAK